MAFRKGIGGCNCSRCLWNAALYGIERGGRTDGGVGCRMHKGNVRFVLCPKIPVRTGTAGYELLSSAVGCEKIRPKTLERRSL